MKFAKLKGRMGASELGLSPSVPAWGWQEWLTIAFVAIIACYRRPEQILRPSFWWEDGLLLFTQDRLYGLGAFAIIPPGGYPVLMHRIIAFLGGFVSLRFVPMFYSACALAFLLLMAAICLRARIPTPYRPWLALSLVLVPQGGEVFLNLNLFHYLCTPLLVLLILQREPVNWRHWLIDFAVLFFVGLSGVFLIFILPVFLLGRFFRGGLTKYNVALSATAIAVAGFQFSFLLHSGRASTIPPSTDNLAMWFNAISINCVGSLLMGNILPFACHVVAWIITPIFLVFLVMIALRADLKVRLDIQCLLACALLIYLSGLCMMRADPMHNDPFHSGQRYFYAPYVLIFWALILACDRPGWMRHGALGILGLALLSAATQFCWPIYPDTHWQDYVSYVEQGYTIEIPINPPGQKILVGPRDRERRQ